MIKASGEKDGVPLLILGLSHENRDRLWKDMPIVITSTEMVALGLPAIEVVLMGGATEEEMAGALRGHGMMKRGL